MKAVCGEYGESVTSRFWLVRSDGGGLWEYDDVMPMLAADWCAVMEDACGEYCDVVSMLVADWCIVMETACGEYDDVMLMLVADWCAVMEAACGEYGDVVPMLVVAVKNGMCERVGVGEKKLNVDKPMVSVVLFINFISSMSKHVYKQNTTQKIQHLN